MTIVYLVISKQKVAAASAGSDGGLEPFASDGGKKVEHDAQLGSVASDSRFRVVDCWRVDGVPDLIPDNVVNMWLLLAQPDKRRATRGPGPPVLPGSGGETGAEAE